MNTDAAVAPDLSCVTPAEVKNLLYSSLNGRARLRCDPLETSVFICVHLWFQFF